MIVRTNQKANILTVARELIQEKGYELFRLEDLLLKLNLSKGGFYHHFKSVEGLLEKLIAEDFQEELNSIQQIHGFNDSKQAIIHLFVLGKNHREKGILKSLGCEKSRQLYLTLMDQIWYEPFKHELATLLKRGFDEGSFPQMNIPVVCELFEAINRQVNRSEILGLWSQELSLQYGLASLALLADQLDMGQEISELTKAWGHHG